jgi:hypothetical protein
VSKAKEDGDKSHTSSPDTYSRKLGVSHGGDEEFTLKKG